MKFVKFFKNTLFYWISPVAASDSFRFPACNFYWKKDSGKEAFCEFCKIFKNIFWQDNCGWLLLNLICEFWEVFQNTSFIEHLWETAFHVQVAEFQPADTMKNYFTGAFQAFYTSQKDASRILLYVFPLHVLRTHHDYFFRRVFESVQKKISFRKYKQKVVSLVIYLFSYDSSK